MGNSDTSNKIKQAKILIAGYHGFGNCGDEAILLAMKNNIKRLYSGVSLTVLSFKPEETERLYGIKSVNRFKPFDVLRAIRTADILISGGGSLLQDETSLRSLTYYLGIIFTAKLFGKKVMLYSNGIGPVSKKISKLLIKLVINNVDLITLRESASLDELRVLGVVRPPVHVTADPAFTLSSYSDGADNEAAALLSGEGIDTGKRLVGVSMRPWKNLEKDSRLVEAVAQLCDYITEAHGKRILFIPMQRGVDTKISELIMQAMKNESFILRKNYASDEILHIIGAMDVVLSMRLHSLIFAGVKNVPMLGFVYDPKVDSFLKLLDMPEAGDLASPDLERLKKTVDDLLNNNAGFREKMKLKTDVLAIQAAKNDELLQTLL